MNKVMQVLGVLAALVQSVAFAAPNGVVSGSVYEITVGAGETVPMSAEDVAALSQPGITEFRKAGPGTLTVLSLPDFNGTIRVSGGTYSVLGSIAKPFGSGSGPTIIESDATVLFRGTAGATSRYDVNFAGEEFQIAGRGVDGKGAICIAAENDAANNRVYLGKLTLLGDALITGPKVGTKATNYPFFSNGFDFNMNGYTLELDCTANTELRSTNIINPGHFVTNGKLVIGAAAVMNHGASSTVTLKSSGSLDFYDNALVNPFNWTIICQVATSTISFNKSATLDSPITIASNCKCLISAGGNEIHLTGDVTGAGSLQLNGTKIYLGGNNAYQGNTIGGTVYIGSPTAIPDHSKCTSVTVAGFVFSSTADGFGIKADEVADLVSGPARGILTGSTDKTFNVPDGGEVEFDADISAWGGNFKNESNGTIVFTKAIQTTRSISFTHTGVTGGFRLSNPDGDVSHLGQLVLRGRMEWFDASLFKSNNTVYCNGTVANPTHLVISNSHVWGEHFNNTSKKLGPFRMGDAAGIDILEILSGSAVSNSVLAATQASSISAIYHRDGDFAILKNYNSDCAIGELGVAYLETAGGRGAIIDHCHLGHQPGSIGLHYMSGGTFNAPTASYNIGQSGNAVYYQNGGAFVCGTLLNIGSSAYDGKCTDPAAQGIRHTFTVEGAQTTATVSGAVKMSERNNTEDTINLNDGGKLTAVAVYRSRYERSSNGTCLPDGGFYTNDNAYVNFNGGILRAGSSIFGDSSVTVETRGTTSRCPRVMVYPKGATIEVSSRAYVRAPIEEPAGQGVANVPMPSAAVTTGLTVPPYIEIVGDGSNATAVALFDSKHGEWTGIKVTSSGFGYTWAKAKIRKEQAGEWYESDCTLGSVSGGGVHFKLDYPVSSGYAQCEINSDCTYTGPTRVSGGRVWINGGSILSRDIQIDADANVVMHASLNGANIHGEGEVFGNWTSAEFTADAQANGLTVSSGKVTIGENPVVVLKNLTGKSQVVPVLRMGSGGSIAGTENLVHATFSGEGVPEGCKAHVEFAEGVLSVRIHKVEGFRMSVR